MQRTAEVAGSDTIVANCGTLSNTASLIILEH